MLLISVQGVDITVPGAWSHEHHGVEYVGINNLKPASSVGTRVLFLQTKKNVKINGRHISGVDWEHRRRTCYTLNLSQDWIHLTITVSCFCFFFSYWTADGTFRIFKQIDLFVSDTVTQLLIYCINQVELYIRVVCHFIFHTVSWCIIWFQKSWTNQLDHVKKTIKILGNYLFKFIL